MKCADKTIKDLLPPYLEQGLERTEQERVEQHLKSCADCREELALLGLLAEESVPDPGEAFWLAMPGRIYREVLQRKEKKRLAFHDLLNVFTIPRWAWTASAVCALAVVSWLLVRPAPIDIAGTSPPGNEAALEDVIAGDPVALEELTPPEFHAAVQWARNESRPIGEAIGEEKTDNTERDVSEDLYDLNPRELDRVYEMLKKKEQELRNKTKKSADEKGLG